MNVNLNYVIIGVVIGVILSAVGLALTAPVVVSDVSDCPECFDCMDQSCPVLYPYGDGTVECVDFFSDDVNSTHIPADWLEAHYKILNLSVRR